MHHAQALYKACDYDEAMKVARQVTAPEYRVSITKLRAAIAFGAEDLATARGLTEECPADDVDTIMNEGCVLYREGEFQKALAKFEEVSTSTDNKPGKATYRGDVSYNIALCYYRLNSHALALKHIADIIEDGESPTCFEIFPTDVLLVYSSSGARLLAPPRLPILLFA